MLVHYEIQNIQADLRGIHTRYPVSRFNMKLIEKYALVITRRIQNIEALKTV